VLCQPPLVAIRLILCPAIHRTEGDFGKCFQQSDQYGKDRSRECGDRHRDGRVFDGVPIVIHVPFADVEECEPKENVVAEAYKLRHVTSDYLTDIEPGFFGRRFHSIVTLCVNHPHMNASSFGLLSASSMYPTP